MRDFIFRECPLCGHSDYKLLPGTEVHFEGQRKAANFICENCGMTPHAVNYIDSEALSGLNRELLSDQYYSSSKSAEYSAYDRSGVKKSYLTELNQFVNWVESFRSLEGLKVLDVGSGEGVLLRELKNRGASPIGIEPSTDLCREQKNQGLSVHPGLVEDFEGSFEPFDLITLAWVLDCFLDPVSALTVIRSMLSEDGHIAIVQATMLDAPLFRYKYGIPIPHQKALTGVQPNLNSIYSHPYYYTANTLNRLMAATGFELVAQRSDRGLRPKFIYKPINSTNYNAPINNEIKRFRRKASMWAVRDKYYVPIFNLVMKILQKTN